jgi:predicted GNAT family acetyltransferase
MDPVTPPAAPTVRFDADAKRFEVRPAGSDAVAFLDVVPGPMVWSLTHTEVPSELEGRGLGTALVRAALAHVRSVGATVMPLCPFVVAHLGRHPEEADVVHERFRYMLRGPEVARG